MLRWALALVRVWTTLYTIGMPRPLADARRAEIESDLWEFEQHLRRPASDRSFIPAPVHVLVRVLLGVPDDLLWRAELMDLRTRRRRIGAWMATGAVLVISALWARSALQPSELPQLPRSPVKLQAWLNKPVPPPPPPPPPPRGARRAEAIPVPPPAPPRPQPARAMPPPPAPMGGNPQ
jgi:hypothetical protein